MATCAGVVYNTNRSLTNSLESTDGLRGGLRGAVLPNDYKSYTRLGKILGLGNKQAVKDWMNSPAFRLAFERLYKSWIEIQQDLATQSGKTRGPDLRAVVDAIDDPHAIAEEKYTSPTGFDSSDFTEVDHYALCLVALRSSNSSSAYGLFRGKTCSQEEIDQRLWQAILRATSDKREERRNKGRLTTHEMRYNKPLINNGQGHDSTLSTDAISKDKPMSEDEPISEDESMSEDEATSEDKPTIKDKPTSEDDPISKDKPIVGASILAGQRYVA